MTTLPPLLTVDAYTSWPVVVADHRLVYGSAPQQFGDLYLPQTPGPHKVVLLIHGGCWRDPYDLSPLGALCHALRKAGMAVWNIEYRRLGNGGGWPRTFQDVATAADFLVGIAPAYQLNLEQVVAAGHSAGGHLALWLAARPNLDQQSPLYAPAPQPLSGVVSLAGIPDMAEAAVRDLCNGSGVELMGGDPHEVNYRYTQGSPLCLMPMSTPQVWINGDADQIIPLDYAQDCLQRARQTKTQVEMTVLPGAGHFELVDPDSWTWPTVRDAIMNSFTE